MRHIRSAAVGIAVVAFIATGCTWSFETLDGTGGKPGSSMSSTGEYNTAVMYNGRPHVFYFADGPGDLRHAYYNGQFWVFETLDGHQNGPNGQIDARIGEHAAAVIYNGRPHVFYHWFAGELRHAWYNGTAWSFESIDGHQNGPNGQTNSGVGTFNAVVLYNGRPHVFYAQGAAGYLRHAWYNGIAWSAETLDGHMAGPHGQVARDVGEYNSVALYNGRPHVFYRDSTNFLLRHGYWNGQFWAFETLDGDGGGNGRIVGAVGEYTSVVIYNGRPHVFYYGQQDANLRHAYYNGVAWAFESLDGTGSAWPGSTTDSVGEDAAAIVYGGFPRVYYYWHDGSYGLREARYTGSAWVFDTIDGEGGGSGATNGDVGRFNAPLVDGSRLRVFYEDLSNDATRHGWFG